jgi:hypothetical protein
VTVVVNGSTDATARLVAEFASRSRVPLAVFTIQYGDKSNAWNHFIHALGPEANTYFFVDGYAVVSASAFLLLATALQDNPLANAAAAVPTSGRSAKVLARRLVASHGLHGSLHALSRSFVSRLRARGFRLPIGLYRGDGLIGSMAMHDLDPRGQPWRAERVAVVPEATWTQRSLSIASPRDIARHFARKVRQARGRLENAAIKTIIYRSGYDGLPAFADDMIRDWLAELAAAHRRKSFRDPFTRIALARLSRAVHPAPAELLGRPIGQPNSDGANRR